MLILAGSDALGELLQEPDSWIREGTAECEIAIDFSTKKNEHRHASLVFSRGLKLKEILSRNRKSMDDWTQPRAHDAKLHDLRVRCLTTTNWRIQKGLEGQCFHEHTRAQAVGTLFSGDAELNPLQEWAIDLH